MPAQEYRSFPLIDAQKLQTIRNLGEPDDADGFFKDLVGMFFDRVPGLLLDIEAAVHKVDAVALERSAHALKGTAGHLGAIRLMKLAEHLEDRGRMGEPQDTKEFLTELQIAYPMTCDMLKTDWL